MNQETLGSGRYVLDREIGAGGMADVYRARDTRLHRDVAVKMFRRGSAEGVARGSGEARMLAALQHPGLVRVLDMDAESASAEPSYLVMEYINGPDLGTVLREGPLPVERTMTAGRDIARSLEYIHGQGIVHRDIKPANVLTRCTDASDGSFSFLLTDFGIARFFESSRVSATGSLIGTATYFSPEQARGDEVGAPTDIYALGLVLIECLTGAPAFPGTGLESALARLSRPPTIPESFGMGWCRLLTAMTLDNPLDRPSAGEVVRRLNAIGRGADVPPLPAPATHRTTTAVAPAAAPAPAAPIPAPAPAAPVPAPAPAAPAPTAESVTGTEPMHTAVPVPGANVALAFSSQSTRDPAHAQTGTIAQPVASRHRAAAVRIRAWVLAAFVVLAGLLVAVLLTVFDADPGPGPSPLPTVPGSTGALLDNLYESVQP